MFNSAVVRFNCDPMRTDFLANLLCYLANDKFLNFFIGMSNLTLNVINPLLPKFAIIKV